MQPPEDNSPHQDRLDGASLRTIGQKLGAYFPQPLRETRLVLMEISPHRLHAYWHITSSDLDAATRHTGSGDSRLVLRFHDLTEPRPNAAAPPSFDIEIEKPSGSSYVELWADAKRYVAELGIRTSDGLIIGLARSNTVEMPRAGCAGQQPARVLTLTPGADQLYRAGPDPIDSAGPDTSQQREGWKENNDQPPDLTLKTGPHRLDPEFPDPSNQPAAPNLSNKAIPADGTTNHAAGHAPIFPMYRTSSLLAESGMGSDWVNPEPPVGIGFPATRGRPAEGTDGARSANPPRPDDLTPSRAATAPSPVSSFSAKNGPDDCLQVDLLIRGKSGRNSHFVFYGQTVRAGDDGSFSLQRRLPPSSLQQVAQLLEACREKK